MATMKFLKLWIGAGLLLTLCAEPAMAQMTAEEAQIAAAKSGNWGIGFGAGIGAGVTILGAGYGISAIAGRAVESIARQPEMAGNIQTAMIIGAALIEGVTFFSLIVCILVLVLS